MKCHKDGCDSAAEYHVGLEVNLMGRMGMDGPRIQATTTIKCCRKHMHDAAAYILSPANKAQITMGLTAEDMPMPEFESAEVVFVPISAPAENFKAAHQGGAIIVN